MVERGGQFKEYQADQANRLDVLHNQNLPVFMQKGLEMRAGLRQSKERDGWPNISENTQTVEDLFNNSKVEINKRWSENVVPILSKFLEEWKGLLPSGREVKGLKKLMSDPEKFDELIKSRDFAGDLESLRQINPDVWKTILIAASERQLAGVELMRHWVKDSSPEDCKRMGMEKTELELAVYIAGLLGKYFDQAYIKQMELADQPGGSQASTLGEEIGAEYVYDVAARDAESKVELKTYNDVFAFEWGKMVGRFRWLATKTEKLLDQKQLPTTYEGLPNYLRKLADVYGSSETNPAQLKKIWSDLQDECVKLVDSGCPIMLIPQNTPGVAGEANKVDVEIRMGLRTPKEKENDSKINLLRSNVVEFLNKNKELVSGVKEPPEIITNFQSYAFGPNLHTATEGETGAGYIMIHANESKEVAMEQLPVLEKVFGLSDLDGSRIANFTIDDTKFHELAHTMMSPEDKVVAKRLGHNPASAALDELKAESVGMILAGDFMKTGEASPQEKNDRFVAKLGVLSSYFGAGGHYEFTATELFRVLMERNIIVPEGERYALKDASAGFDVIADYGKKLLDDYYLQPDIKPFQIKDHVNKIKEANRSNTDLQALIKYIKDNS